MMTRWDGMNKSRSLMSVHVDAVIHMRPSMVSKGGSEPMSLGSPTSPKAGPGAQFLPGFLMGDLPAPASPQPRSFSLSAPGLEPRTPLHSAGIKSSTPAWHS